MINETDVVYQFLSGKYGLVYKGRDYDAVRAITDASKKKSLSDLKKSEENFTKGSFYGIFVPNSLQEITGDLFIRKHFDNLFENLVESNLNKIVEPYSRVQIKHIATTIGLSEDIVV